MLPIDICAICGDVIPEGRHICFKCEKEHYNPKVSNCLYLTNASLCLLTGKDCSGLPCDFFIDIKKRGES